MDHIYTQHVHTLSLTVPLVQISHQRKHTKAGVHIYLSHCRSQIPEIVVRY